MRLVAGLLALTLTGTLAFADESKAPEPQPGPVETARSKVSLRVVRVMPESHQALLFDKNRGTHVLADVGSVIGTYTVMEISEDEVTLSSAGRELVLASPDQSWRRRRDADEAPITANNAPVADTRAVVAPSGPDGAVTAAKPIAAAQDGVRIASAPYDEAGLDAALTDGAGSVRVATAPTPAITATEMEVDPYGEPAPAEPAPAANPVAKPGDEGMRAFVEAMNGQVIVAPAAPPATLLSRKEVIAALSDFAMLTQSVRGAFTPAGARLDVIAPGSVFAKAGLQNGDVITAIDGHPLTSIDDAADLYIRAGSMKTSTVQIVRAGKPMTLRIAIR